MKDCKYLDGELDVEPSDDGMSEVVHGTVPICMFHDGDKDECPYPDRDCPAKPPEDFEKIENFRDELFKKILEKSMKEHSGVLRELARPWMDTMFITSVGSHMWGMERPNSDSDLFLVYRAPLKGILTGQKPRSYQDQQHPTIDIAIHEIGKVIHQIGKNNVNFVWGVMSPLIVDDRMKRLDELRALVKLNLSQRIFHSIRGLADHNYEKYLMGDRGHKLGKEAEQKKMNIIARTCRFGIDILNGEEEWDFSPCHVDKEELQNLMADLTRARNESPLAEEPRHLELLYDWLAKFRLGEVRDDVQRDVVGRLRGLSITATKGNGAFWAHKVERMRELGIN